MPLPMTTVELAAELDINYIWMLRGPAEPQLLVRLTTFAQLLYCFSPLCLQSPTVHYHSAMSVGIVLAVIRWIRPAHPLGVPFGSPNIKTAWPYLRQCSHFGSHGFSVRIHT